MFNIEPANLMWILLLTLTVIFESWAVYTGHQTLSQVIWEARHTDYWFLPPLFTGLLLGHFFL